MVSERLLLSQYFVAEALVWQPASPTAAASRVTQSDLVVAAALWRASVPRSFRRPECVLTRRETLRRQAAPGWSALQTTPTNRIHILALHTDGNTSSGNYHANFASGMKHTTWHAPLCGSVSRLSTVRTLRSDECMGELRLYAFFYLSRPGRRSDDVHQRCLMFRVRLNIYFWPMG